MDKVYFDNGRYCVYLNRVNTIKIKRYKDDKVFDYLKDLYHKEDHPFPKYVVNRCSELHRMWHNDTIHHFIASFKK